MGRTLSETRGNAAWTYTYNDAGQTTSLTDPLGNRTALAYDGAGNLVSVTEALGNVTRYEYDSLGRLIKETERGRKQPDLCL